MKDLFSTWLWKAVNRESAIQKCVSHGFVCQIVWTITADQIRDKRIMFPELARVCCIT